MPPLLGIYKPFELEMYAHFHSCSQCGINGREKRLKPQRSDADQVGLSITKQTLANSDKGLYFLPSISLRHVKFEYFLCSFAKQSRRKTFSFVMPVHPSVPSHRTFRLPLAALSSNFISRI